jgi:hypothetical protein
MKVKKREQKNSNTVSSLYVQLDSFDSHWHQYIPVVINTLLGLNNHCISSIRSDSKDAFKVLSLADILTVFQISGACGA